MTMPPADTGRFDEAIAWFRRNLPDFGDEALDSVVKKVRVRSAGLSKWAQLDLVTEVWRGIDSAIANGDTFQDFRDSVRKKMLSRWGITVDGHAERLDVIFRTNVQKAYVSGRYIQASDPTVRKARPYWKFSAIMDKATTPICHQCNETILLADDPWWKTHLPPLHHQCRSTFITLRASQAKKMGIDKEGPDMEPKDGFGSFKDNNAHDEPKPDLGTYPQELVKWYTTV